MTSPAKTKEATFYNFKKCTNIDSTHTLVKNKCQSYSQCHGQGHGSGWQSSVQGDG